MPVEEALAQVYEEYERASAKYPPFSSMEEAFTQIHRQFYQLLAELCSPLSLRNSERIKREVTQVGAMAVRLLVDIPM